MKSHISRLDDESLLHQVQKGNHDAFSELVYRHSNRFYTIAFRILANKDDAEDIVQDAFLKLWKKPEIWNSTKQTKFTTWFYRVVTNLCLDHNKKKKPNQLPENFEFAGKTSPNDVQLETKQQQMILENLIQELPQRQQLALNLCFYEGLSNKEAAEIIDIKVKALQSLLMRAKTTLKKKIHNMFNGAADYDN